MHACCRDMGCEQGCRACAPPAVAAARARVVGTAAVDRAALRARVQVSVQLSALRRVAQHRGRARHALEQPVRVRARALLDLRPAAQAQRQYKGAGAAALSCSAQAFSAVTAGLSAECVDAWPDHIQGSMQQLAFSATGTPLGCGTADTLFLGRHWTVRPPYGSIHDLPVGCVHLPQALGMLVSCCRHTMQGFHAAGRTCDTAANFAPAGPMRCAKRQCASALSGCSASAAFL